MPYKTLIFISFLEFILVVSIGGNYMLGIKEYALFFGSDELTIFKHAEYYIEVGSLSVVPLKFVISSLLIAFSLKFGSFSLLVLFFLKYSIHLLSVYILLRSINKYVNRTSFKIFGAFLYLNPIFHSYHNTLLRDDLILFVALLTIGYSIRIFDRDIYLSKSQNALTWMIIAITIFVGMGLRPEVFLLLTIFLCLIYFINVGLIKKIGLVCVILFFMFIYGKKILLIYSYALANAGWLDFIYVLEAFRVFYFSPAPWNITTIATEVLTDATKSYLWYYISFFVTAVSVILFPLYALKKNSMLFKIGVDNPIGIWFLYLPIFITVCYGIIANDMVFLGPRQGILPSALLTLVFINTLMFSFGVRSRRNGIF